MALNVALTITRAGPTSPTLSRSSSRWDTAGGAASPAPLLDLGGAKGAAAVHDELREGSDLPRYDACEDLRREEHLSR